MRRAHAIRLVLERAQPQRPGHAGMTRLRLIHTPIGLDADRSAGPVDARCGLCCAETTSLPPLPACTTLLRHASGLRRVSTGSSGMRTPDRPQTGRMTAAASGQRTARVRTKGRMPVFRFAVRRPAVAPPVAPPRTPAGTGRSSLAQTRARTRLGASASWRTSARPRSIPQRLHRAGSLSCLGDQAPPAPPASAGWRRRVNDRARAPAASRGSRTARPAPARPGSSALCFQEQGRADPGKTWNGTNILWQDCWTWRPRRKPRTSPETLGLRLFQPEGDARSGPGARSVEPHGKAVRLRGIALGKATGTASSPVVPLASAGREACRRSR